MDERITASTHIATDRVRATSYQPDRNTHGTFIGHIDFDGATVKIRDVQEHLEELTSLLFSLLGVNIYDGSGDIRDISEIEQELRSKNPKIIMTFEELMRFE